MPGIEAVTQMALGEFWVFFLQYLTRNNKKPQPKFLTKEERAKLAIAKRAQEIREETERRETTRRDRDALEREADELAQQDRNNKYGGQSVLLLCSSSGFHLYWFTFVLFFIS
jgi:hypothetical protein